MQRPSEFERHAFLIARSPTEAARILLEGDFWIDEEEAICFALRRHPEITLDDDAILDLMFEAHEQGATPDALVETLVAASRKQADR
ncbi:MAG: hypothetical protein AAF845_10355 [Bacteroidota bacterium]